MGSRVGMGKSWGLRLALCALAVLFATPAVTSASAPSTSWTITAPYSGYPIHHSGYINQGGCAHATIGSPQYFNLSTGIGGFNDSTHARSCAGNSGLWSLG